MRKVRVSEQDLLTMLNYLHADEPEAVGMRALVVKELLGQVITDVQDCVRSISTLQGIAAAPIAAANAGTGSRTGHIRAITG
jgi:Trp operon repressor